MCLTLSSEHAGWTSEKHTSISMDLDTPDGLSVSRDSTLEDVVPPRSLEPVFGAQGAD